MYSFTVEVVLSRANTLTRHRFLTVFRDLGLEFRETTDGYEVTFLSSQDLMDFCSYVQFFVDRD